MNSSDLRAREVRITDDTLSIDLMDGRTVSVPLTYYPTLLHATSEERSDCAPIGAAYGIEWPRLDYHLSVEGIVGGIPEAPNLARSVPAKR